MHTTEHSHDISIWRQAIYWIHRCPCLISYAVGGSLGALVALCRPRLRKRTAFNVAQSGCISTANTEKTAYGFAVRVLFYAGVCIVDTLASWILPWSWCRDWVTSVDGWEAVCKAYQEQPEKGTLFLTPHLGCFELAAAWVGYQQPLMFMYRPPRQVWLDRLMQWGRQRGQSTLVSADLKGVRALLKELKRGGCVGILPDQVPQRGEGVWATFFGRPAYTITLVSRLLQATRPRCILAIAERRPGLEGVHLHFEQLPDLPEDMTLEQAVQQLNHALESAVRRFPEQYLWGYNRYKVPTGVEAPVEGKR